MNGFNLVLNILPIILFVAIEVKYGLKAGIISAVLLSIGLGLWMFYKTGELDNFLILEVAFIIGLGALSIKLKNSQYFKFQPMIIGICISLYMLYMQIFAEPILIHYLPMAVTMNPEMKEVLNNPQLLKLFETISMHLIVLFFLHALAVGYAAVKFSNFHWLLVRLAIYPLMFLLFIADKILFGS